MITPPPRIDALAKLFARLPGIGMRQSIRLAFYIADLPGDLRKKLIDALTALDGLSRCTTCFFAHGEKDAICSLCSNEKRDKNIVMLVEKDTDRISIEGTGTFQGWYLVIGSLTKNGTLTATHKERIAAFMNARKTEAPLQEIILALPPTPLGDAYIESIASLLRPLTEKITRLGRGVPIGADIEFMDSETLASALKGRV